VKTDSIKFHVDRKENDKVLICIKNIYLDDFDKILEEYLQEDDEFGESSEQVSLGHCMTMPGYWQPTWICFSLSVLNQGTGITAINMFSTDIFTTMQENGSSLSPTTGT